MGCSMETLVDEITVFVHWVYAALVQVTIVGVIVGALVLVLSLVVKIVDSQTGLPSGLSHIADKAWQPSLVVLIIGLVLLIAMLVPPP